jgi:hypothetical protein
MIGFGYQVKQIVGSGSQEVVDHPQWQSGWSGGGRVQWGRLNPIITHLSARKEKDERPFWQSTFTFLSLLFKKKKLESPTYLLQATAEELNDEYPMKIVVDHHYGAECWSNSSSGQAVFLNMADQK